MADIKFDNAQWVTIIVGLIGAISPLVALAMGMFEKVLLTRQEKKKLDYEQYHALILQITSNAKGFADCQIAEVFELRRFRNNRYSSINVLKSFYNANKLAFDKPDNYLGKTIRSTINSLSCPIPIVWRFVKRDTAF
jgi:hypothetical protein